jgi:pre-mRNA-splicing helicase BRR2
MLASSQSESERSKIRKKMSEDSTLTKILHQLETGKGEDDNDETMEARAQRKRREENEDTGGPGGLVQGTRNVIDLDDIAFVQGSHFMPNKRCHLPDGSFRKQRKGYALHIITCK